jgi:hypothetical protein
MIEMAKNLNGKSKKLKPELSQTGPEPHPIAASLKLYGYGSPTLIYCWLIVSLRLFFP